MFLLFHWKETTAESHQILVETYAEHALYESHCRTWFQRFKSGDFNVINKERENRPKKFEVVQLQTILYADVHRHTQKLVEQLNVTQQAIFDRLRAMRKIQKV